ncbi:MAG: hypothetical protein ACI9OJ_000408 [Myxococcota bacterium]|jgi:hypothetical protein
MILLTFTAIALTSLALVLWRLPEPQALTIRPAEEEDLGLRASWTRCG